jgi:hypothetical protein
MQEAIRTVLEECATWAVPIDPYAHADEIVGGRVHPTLHARAR